DGFLRTRQVKWRGRANEPDAIARAATDMSRPDWRILLRLGVNAIQRRADHGPVGHVVERIEGNGTSEPFEAGAVHQVHQLYERKDVQTTAGKFQQPGRHLRGSILAEGHNQKLKKKIR